MHAPGGVRITETELELMALAEYVRELEGKLAKQQARSAGQQEARNNLAGDLTNLLLEGLCERFHSMLELHMHRASCAELTWQSSYCAVLLLGMSQA